jgi:hypothetical protein
MSGARAGISAAEINKGGVGAATVKRYWPGKAPDWVDEDGEQARSEEEEEQRDEAEVSSGEHLHRPLRCTAPGVFGHACACWHAVHCPGAGRSCCCRRYVGVHVESNLMAGGANGFPAAGGDQAGRGPAAGAAGEQPCSAGQR